MTRVAWAGWALAAGAYVAVGAAVLHLFLRGAGWRVTARRTGWAAFAGCALLVVLGWPSAAWEAWRRRG